MHSADFCDKMRFVHRRDTGGQAAERQKYNTRMRRKEDVGRSGGGVGFVHAVFGREKHAAF